LRGNLLEGYLDDELVVSGTDDRRLKGYLGLRTWNEAGKYRNLKFTDPQGNVLWQGLPEVPATISPAAADPDHRDYDVIATGQWQPMLAAGEKTVEIRNATFHDGVIEIQDGHAYDKTIKAVDVIVRAQVQKLRDQNVMLTLRDVMGVYYSAFYECKGE